VTADFRLLSALAKVNRNVSTELKTLGTFAQIRFQKVGRNLGAERDVCTPNPGGVRGVRAVESA
jgi:hypothetical protein